ncbi:MAG: hypothetical protein KC503_27575 [Myxococcales bacterium]|nr:hypothetical protein [Myxococcales bacterium]
MARTFRVTLRKQRDGMTLVTCEGPACLARSHDEAEALERIREEIRYRLEWCPCSALEASYVQLDVVRER